MKAKFTSRKWSVAGLLTLLLVLGYVADAQLPDCNTGNTVYAVFNRDTNDTRSPDSSEIRPLNVTTGAIGSLVGGKRYLIRKYESGSGSSSVYIHGTSGMAVDMITNRLYVVTQMRSTAINKDIMTIDPVTGTMTVIGTTPASLVEYHFVKMGISPTGVGYMIGVAMDSTPTTIANYNVLVKFTPCNSSATCANPTIVGYLPSTGNMRAGKLYNGDIAFDVFGNLYFLTVAFDRFSSSNLKYTDARLFRIDAANVPTSAGTGTIPMTFMADYNSLDTTVVNGIAFSNSGDMVLATRRFVNNNTNPSAPWNTEFYMSTAMGSATQIVGAGPIPSVPFKMQAADLAACYFPMTILSTNKFQLQHRYEDGNVKLTWQMLSNSVISSFDIQRSNDGVDFETIGTVTADAQKTTYSFNDPQSGFETHKFYRIRANMSGSLRQYTNVVNVTFNNKVSLLASVKPNPFNSQLEASLWLRRSDAIYIRILDQSGRTVYSQQLGGRSGSNTVKIEGLGRLKPGAYVMEMRVQDEVLREKVIKQ